MILSTNNPDSSSDADAWRRTLDVDRIDVYNFHGINWSSFENSITRPGGALEAARKAQAEGLFTCLSFSFHD